MSVFIVEDELTLQLLYKKALNLAGLTVAGTAKDGREAVDKFRSFSIKPRVVIMDYRMPIKNGIEATKEILEIDSNTKIIFASADKTVKQLAFATGAAAFIEKPFKLVKLIREIKKLMS